MPIVIRIPYGGGIGAVEHHSESPEAYFAHTAGLRVLTPATRRRPIVTIQQAIACADPVVFFEPKRRYWDKGEVDECIDLSTAARCPHPGGRASRRPGTDVTIACYGPMVRTCLEAAEAAAEAALASRSSTCSHCRHSTSTRSWHSVERTGRLVVVHEAPALPASAPRSPRRSPSAASTRSRHRCCASRGYDVPYPPSRLEEHHLPDLDRILDAVDRSLAH